MSQGWRRYEYARVMEFHDGDTCSVEIDHGFKIKQTISVRLFGVSCPETRGKERAAGALALAGAMEFLLPRPPECLLWTWKLTFTRYVGRILVHGTDDLARCLLERGLGRAWDGKTERPEFAAFPVVDTAVEVEEYERILKRDWMEAL